MGWELRWREGASVGETSDGGTTGSSCDNTGPELETAGAGAEISVAEKSGWKVESDDGAE